MIELNKILDAADRSGLPVILTGDINVDTLSSDNFSKEYFDLLQKFHLFQHIREPTRISTQKKSLIDHVVTNSLMKSVKANVVCYTVADHLPTLTLWKHRKEVINEKNYDTFTRINYKKLKKLMILIIQIVRRLSMNYTLMYVVVLHNQPIKCQKGTVPNNHGFVRIQLI